MASHCRGVQQWSNAASAYIGKLGELGLGGSHAQVLTNLTRQHWAGAASEDQGAAHSERIEVACSRTLQALGGQLKRDAKGKFGKAPRTGIKIAAEGSIRN